jgi:transcriptional regulator with XRE-family HTH domain
MNWNDKFNYLEVKRMIMALSTDQALQHISSIRKTMQRSVHDCAGILGISEAKYLAFEQGEDFLSLPELELLSLYLNIPLQELFEHNVQTNSTHHLLQSEIRSQYKLLRDKIIQTQLVLTRRNKQRSLDDLAQETGITRETLEAYELGQIAIPLNDLKSICRALACSIEKFFPEKSTLKIKQDGTSHRDHWQSEYPNGEAASGQEEDPYQQLLAALKQIPEEDQARIAKQLLNKLKNT